MLFQCLSLGKCYAVLSSYSNEAQDLRHAAVAISLDDSVYMMVLHYSIVYKVQKVFTKFILFSFDVSEFQEGSRERMESVIVTQVRVECFLQRESYSCEVPIKYQMVEHSA